MLVTKKHELKHGEIVTLVGVVSKKDSTLFYIKTHSCEIPVRYKEILGYTTGHVIVKGTVDSEGVVVEETVIPLKEGLDLKLFDDFANLSKQFPEII